MPRNPDNPQWTMWADEHVAMLKAKWLDHSASEIADMLTQAFGTKYTRSAVIGKANRLYLHKKPSWRKPVKPKPESKPRARAVKAKRVTLPALPINRPEVIDEKPLRPSAFVALPGTTPIRLEDLGNEPRAGYISKCRWPIGENPTLFCGCEAHDIYCPTHMARAYRPKEVAA